MPPPPPGWLLHASVPSGQQDIHELGVRARGLGCLPSKISRGLALFKSASSYFAVSSFLPVVILILFPWPTQPVVPLRYSKPKICMRMTAAMGKLNTRRSSSLLLVHNTHTSASSSCRRAMEILDSACVLLSSSPTCSNASWAAAHSSCTVSSAMAALLEGCCSCSCPCCCFLHSWCCRSSSSARLAHVCLNLHCRCRVSRRTNSAPHMANYRALSRMHSNV